MLGKICTTKGCKNEQMAQRRICNHCEYIKYEPTRSKYKQLYKELKIKAGRLRTGPKRTNTGLKVGDKFEAEDKLLKFWSNFAPLTMTSLRQRTVIAKDSKGVVREYPYDLWDFRKIG